MENGGFIIENWGCRDMDWGYTLKVWGFDHATPTFQVVPARAYFIDFVSLISSSRWQSQQEPISFILSHWSRRLVDKTSKSLFHSFRLVDLVVSLTKPARAYFIHFVLLTKSVGAYFIDFVSLISSSRWQSQQEPVPFIFSRCLVDKTSNSLFNLFYLVVSLTKPLSVYFIDFVLLI